MEYEFKSQFSFKKVKNLKNYKDKNILKYNYLLKTSF